MNLPQKTITKRTSMKKKLYINDIILNLIIILLCIAVPVGIYLTTKDETKTVAVSVDGREVWKQSVDEDGLCEANGVVVTVRDGKAYVTHSDCPDGLCMDMKKAQNVGDSIVCVPNRVSVKIVGDGEKEADVVAG